MQDYEKLGLFYLGRTQEAAAPSAEGELLLYDARDLTTHALLLGMTGSGKTGLATALMEEAAIDSIPAILIDPKGDLGNLLLQFPELRAEEFRPWIDESEARRKGVSVDELAASTAESWRKGLASWGQDGERIRRLRDSADFAIYTPGNAACRPLQVLRSFDAPPATAALDGSALRDRIMGAVSGLLGLLGRDADPVQSRDHILLSNIFDNAWRHGRDLDIPALIGEVQQPPFDKIGVFDLDTFYPARERMGLAMALNNVIASPGFSAWMEGEPLDIQRLLHTPQGRPRISILYLAHLSDSERMFFVTILLNEIVAWMRAQSGTSSLRALLYMDEIFGYFPPGANPPSKTPMLTLLKQARAFGLGVVLSTQNPVDLDYKGLSNCGTWFIGRLQTERDKARVLAGLEGAAASAGGGFDRGATEQLLAGLGNRTFLMRNVHQDAPVLFQTRWALSYLRGPLTLPQLAPFARRAEPPAAPSPAIQQSAPAAPAAATTEPPPAAVPSSAAPSALPPATVAAVPSAPPPEVPVCYLRPKRPGGAIIYRPRVLGQCKMHFVDAKAALDVWQSRALVAPFDFDGGSPEWSEATELADLPGALDSAAAGGAELTELPAAALAAKNYPVWGRMLATEIYQNATLNLFTYPELKLTSAPGESEGDFRVRVGERLREVRDEQVAKLKARYAPKLQTLSDQLRRAEERVQREKAQAGQQKVSTALAIGATLLGAMMGRGARSIGTVGRATTAARSASRIGKETGDVARAEENVEVLQGRLKDLQEQFDAEVAALRESVAPQHLELQERSVRPRKTDIMVSSVGICWEPWRRAADGALEPA